MASDCQNSTKKDKTLCFETNCFPEPSRATVNQPHQPEHARTRSYCPSNWKETNLASRRCPRSAPVGLSQISVADPWPDPWLMRQCLAAGGHQFVKEVALLEDLRLAFGLHRLWRRKVCRPVSPNREWRGRQSRTWIIENQTKHLLAELSLTTEHFPLAGTTHIC